MSVQNDKEIGEEVDQSQGQEQQATEKPEVEEKHKEKAAKIMTAYEDQPTVVLPGSGGMITGTAVNEWLDEDGNPKFGDTESNDKAGSDGKDGGSDDFKEQVEKDKALNVELRKAAAEENKGEEKKRTAR
jgi:hypothetical protein